MTDLLSFINIYLHPSSNGKCLFKVDALGTLFPDDILTTLGVDVFPEYVGWSLEGWNFDLTARLFDRFDFNNLSGMFRGDLDLYLLDFCILPVFFLGNLDQDFVEFEAIQMQMSYLQFKTESARHGWCI